jgi:hypothetical protein
MQRLEQEHQVPVVTTAPTVRPLCGCRHLAWKKPIGLQLSDGLCAVVSHA